MTTLKQDKQKTHLWRLRYTYFNNGGLMYLEIMKARRIKFDKYENNFPYT